MRPAAPPLLHGASAARSALPRQTVRPRQLKTADRCVRSRSVLYSYSPRIPRQAAFHSPNVPRTPPPSSPPRRATAVARGFRHALHRKQAARTAQARTPDTAAAAKSTCAPAAVSASRGQRAFPTDNRESCKRENTRSMPCHSPVYFSQFSPQRRKNVCRRCKNRRSVLC